MFSAATHSVRSGQRLPETPHELPIVRARVDTLLDRVRKGERIDIHEEFLNCVDWRSAFAKESVCWPTSRWLMRHFFASCTNSIGSSTVRMWPCSFSLM